MSVEVEQDYKLFQGDCFDVLPSIPDGSIDFILTDPPYGCLKCEWDVKPDIRKFFQESRRVLKSNGAMAIFGCLPFSLDWIMEGRDWLKYELIWSKTCAANFLNANRRPICSHENIYIYISGSNSEFYAQRFDTGSGEKSIIRIQSANRYAGFNEMGRNSYIQDSTRLYKSVLNFSNFNGAGFDSDHQHPTQKPIPLLELLVKWYTSEGQTILDPFMGSGSTGVACMNLKRKFIGVELDEKFYGIAEKRIQTAVDNYQFKLFEE